MELRIIKDYKSIDEFRRSFNELAGKTFGIDFERWHQAGFWNDRYRCYSFVEGKRIVSNVSISILDVIYKGKKIPAIQIGTVMTSQEFRGIGLATKLMNEVLKDFESECDIFYLFGNKSVTKFYQKFGFASVRETRFYTDAKINNTNVSPKARKLNISDAKDLDILKRLAKERAVLSDEFEVTHTEAIFTWHCFNVFPDSLYYSESLDTIIIYKVEENILQLYDVVIKEKYSFREIISVLGATNYNKIVFHFTPDYNDIQIKREKFETDEYTFLVKSDYIRLEGEFFYPCTAHA